MKKVIMHIILISIVISLLALFSYVYTKNTKEKLEQNTQNNLLEITVQNADKLSEKINEHKNLLKTITDIIIAEKITDENEIFKLFNYMSGNEVFSRFTIVYKNGQGITSDGYIGNISEKTEEWFRTDEILISEHVESKVDNKYVNIYTKKVNIDNHEFVCGLVIDEDRYKEIFSKKNFDGAGFLFIIDKDGKIISNTSEFQNRKYLLNTIIDKNYNQCKNCKNNLEKIVRDVKEGKDGTIYIHSSAGKTYIAYSPLEINDWYLISVSPEEVIAKEISEVLIYTYLTTAIIILIVFAMMIYIIISNKKRQKKLYELAYIDFVTGEGNYYYFKEKSQQYIEKHKTKSTYIMTIDIDRFKAINHKYGQDIGEKVLKEFAKSIKQLLPSEHIIARLSNDNFGVLAEIEDVDVFMEQITEKLNILRVDDLTIGIAISAGICLIKETDKNIMKVIDKANMARSLAKGDAIKKIYLFEEKIEQIMLNEAKIEAHMNRGIENREFKVCYQPKTNCKNNKLYGAEALVRWERKGKTISPGDFIPLFEKNRFILKLDYYIFEQVCKDMKDWNEKYNYVPIVSVNVSQEHFTNPSFVDNYSDIADKYGVDKSKIELEITESATTDESIDIIELMKKIKSKGFSISLDDFGKGYSSLGLLQGMPIDTLKIDKVFIDQANLDNTEDNMLENIMYIAQKMHLKTVMEGVETEEQVNYLKKIGCDYIQGYYYAKPMDKESFEIYFNEK